MAAEAAVELTRGDSRLREELTGPEALGSMFSSALLSVDSTDENPTGVWGRMKQERGAGAIRYYAEMEEKVDVYGALLEGRINAVLSKGQHVEPRSDDARDQRVAEYCDRLIDLLPDWRGVLEQMLDAMGKGVAIGELMWQFDGSEISLESIRFRNAEYFGFAPLGGAEVGPLRLTAGGQDVELPEAKFVVCTFGKRYENRWGRPLGRRCFWQGWFLRQGSRFWLRFCEKGNGTVLAKYQGSADEDTRRRALAAAKAINEHTAAAIPEDFLVELLEGARGGGTDVYERLVRRFEGSIAKTVLGQTLTSAGSDQGTGSMALGQVHNDVRQEYVEADAHRLSLWVEQRIFRPAVALQFGPDVLPPRYVIEAEEGEDLGQAADLLGKARKLGLRIARSYAHERLQIPEPEQADADLLGAAPAEASANGPNGPDGTPPAEPGAPQDGSQFSDQPPQASEVDKIMAAGIRAGRVTYKAWVDELIGAALRELPEEVGR
ncbi:MAG: DUF935 family protein [Acidobacteria bacterium]|nr:DUF935 family protein [Acidobacteriota bacterium]